MNSQPTEPPSRPSFLGGRKRAARDERSAAGWPTDFSSGRDDPDGWDYPDAPSQEAVAPDAAHPGSGAYPDAGAHPGSGAFPGPGARPHPGAFPGPGPHPDPGGHPDEGGYPDHGGPADQGGHPERSGYRGFSAEAGPVFGDNGGYPAYADRSGLPLSDYSSMPDYPPAPAAPADDAYPYPPGGAAPPAPAVRGPFTPARPAAAGPPPGTGPIPALDAWGQTVVAHDEYAYPGSVPDEAAHGLEESGERAHADGASADTPRPGSAAGLGHVLSHVAGTSAPEGKEDEETRWAVLAYLTVPFFGPVLPLAVYLRSLGSPWLRGHAAQALNVWLTVLLYEVSAVIVGAMLYLDSAQAAVEVLAPLVAALWLVALFYLVQAARAASRGGELALPRWLCSPMAR